MQTSTQAAALAHYVPMAAQLTQPERDAHTRAIAHNSAHLAGVQWPAMDASIDAPEGIQYTLLLGCALLDVVVDDDDSDVFVSAVQMGGAWVAAQELGDSFNAALDAALQTALAIDAWCAE